MKGSLTSILSSSASPADDRSERKRVTVPTRVRAGQSGPRLRIDHHGVAAADEDGVTADRFQRVAAARQVFADRGGYPILELHASVLIDAKTRSFHGKLGVRTEFHHVQQH